MPYVIVPRTYFRFATRASYRKEKEEEEEEGESLCISQMETVRKRRARAIRRFNPIIPGD